MKFESGDLQKIQWVALLAAVLLALAVAIGLRLGSDTRKAQAERDAAAGRKTEIERRLAQVRTEEQEIKARTQEYHLMEAAGIIGPEQRLDWTELLRDLQQQLRLPGMSYEFGPQMALEAKPEAAYGFHSSQLRIQLRLLHEEDLLNFIARVQREAKALVILRHCKVSRLPMAAAGLSPARLAAECAMEWVTVRPLGAGKKP